MFKMDIRKLPLLLLSAALFACGSSGGDAEKKQKIDDGGVPVENQNPSVSIAGDSVRSLHQGKSLTLTANASDDDGDTLNYDWKISPSGNDALSSSNSKTATFTASTDMTIGSTYDITVTVSDGQGGSTTSEAVTITIVADDKPIANFSATPSVNQYHRNTLITLDASTSSAGQGNEVNISYNWKLTANPGGDLTLDGNGSTRTFTPTTVATYTVELTVTVGTETSDVFKEDFKVINRPPTVSIAGDSVRSLKQSEDLTLTATASDDDGDTLNYDWKISPSGNDALLSSSNSKTATFNPNKNAAVDRYDITVTVSDGQGGSSTSEAVTIEIINSPPTVSIAGDSVRSLKQSEDLTLTATASDDDGDTLNYDWKISPSGNDALLSSSNSKTATFNPNKNATVGRYDITVTVSDGQGGSTPATVTITISGPLGETTIETAPSSTTLYHGEKITLKASNEGAAISYTWQAKKKSDDSDVSSQIKQDDFDSKVAIFTAPADSATYEITATASDGSDSSVSSPLNLEVIVLPKAVITTPGSITKDVEATWSAEDNNGIGELRYQWTLEHSPDGATVLGDATNETLNYIPNQEGKYRLKLTVTDAENNSDSSSHVFGAGTYNNKEPIAIVSSIISVDPRGLTAGQSQYLMVQAHAPDGDMLFTEWSVTPESCGNFADDGKYQDSLFALIHVPSTASGNCNVTAKVTDGYQIPPVPVSKTFAIQAAAPTALAFSYRGDDSRSFMLPAHSASYTVPVKYYDDSAVQQKTATKLWFKQEGWNCLLNNAACPSSSDIADITFTNAEQEVTLSKDDISITLSLLSKDDPATAILSRADLEQVSEGLAGKYYQLATLDLSGLLHRPGNSKSNRWEKIIGKSPNEAFTGLYDGQSLPLRKLHIQQSEQENIGLFGYSSGSEIKNIALQGFYVRGKDKVGGLVGNSTNATILNSYARGAVFGTNTVGGLVGENDGSIENSYVRGAAFGADSVGGLVGINESNIKKSYTVSLVSGEYYIGGLSGTNQGGSIENSYARGTVSGKDMIGGLVGYRISGSISYSYASGDARSGWPISKQGDPERVGGLVGNSDGSSNSYWDTEARGRTKNTAGTELSSEEMKQSSNYNNWDFSNIWNIANTINDGYPYLLCVAGQIGYTDQAIATNTACSQTQ